MNLIPKTLYKTKRKIIDADVSLQIMVVLQKGKGENIVIVNERELFTVCAQAYMIRIFDDGLVLYDGKDLQFFTFDGTCTHQVTVGRHVFDLIPMKDAVACTYRDQGVYDDSIGKEKIVLVKRDGTLTSHLSFALENRLDFDILFARVKPYACISPKTNKILYFNQYFQLQKAESCSFELGNVIAMSYQYPYFLFLEEDKWMCLHENGLYHQKNRSFSVNVRGHYHRGPFVFLETLEQEVIGYLFAEHEEVTVSEE